MGCRHSGRVQENNDSPDSFKTPIRSSRNMHAVIDGNDNDELILADRFNIAIGGETTIRPSHSMHAVIDGNDNDELILADRFNIAIGGETTIRPNEFFLHSSVNH